MFLISMKLTILFFLLCLWAIFSRATEARAQEAGDSASVGQRVVLKWLGNASWEIELGQTIILIDPFLTRKQPNAAPGLNPTTAPLYPT